MKSKTGVQLLTTLVGGLLAISAQAADWQPLFEGADMKGWEQVGGKARYEMQDGDVVGYTVANTPNSFLVTKKRYSRLHSGIRNAPGRTVQFGRTDPQ